MRCLLRTAFRIPVMWLLAALSWQWCMYALKLMFIDNHDFNKGCLFVVIFKVLVGDGIWDWFDWFSYYVLPAAAGSIVMTVVYWLLYIDDHWWRQIQKGFLLVLIYKVLVGDEMFGISLTNFHTMSFHAAAGGIVFTVVYACIYIGVHWWWWLWS